MPQNTSSFWYRLIPNRFYLQFKRPKLQTNLVSASRGYYLFYFNKNRSLYNSFVRIKRRFPTRHLSNDLTSIRVFQFKKIFHDRTFGQKSWGVTSSCCALSVFQCRCVSTLIGSTVAVDSTCLITRVVLLSCSSHF